MNRRLEQYLGEAEQNLQDLPPARRLEEMDEMRQHLAASIQAHKELGLNPDEATEAAVTQFGKARQVGASLKRVWWREQIGGPRGLWKTVALALALGYTLDGVLYPLTLLRAIPRPANENWLAFDLLIVFLNLVLPATIVGILLGRLTPRNAVAGALLARTLYLLHTALYLLLQSLIPHAEFKYMFEYSARGASLQLVVTVLAAWLTVCHTKKRIATAR